MIVHQTYEIFADYFQIVLEDAGLKAVERDFRFSQQSLADRVWTDVGMVILFTARNMTVPVDFDVLEQPPTDSLTEWDHVAEASIEITSGQVELYGVGAYQGNLIPIASGVYRVRMYHGSLGSLSGDGLEGEDHYRIVLWRDTPIQPRVLKLWVEAG